MIGRITSHYRQIRFSFFSVGGWKGKSSHLAKPLWSRPHFLHDHFAWSICKEIRFGFLRIAVTKYVPKFDLADLSVIFQRRAGWVFYELGRAFFRCEGQHSAEESHGATKSETLLGTVRRHISQFISVESNAENFCFFTLLRKRRWLTSSPVQLKRKMYTRQEKWADICAWKVSGGEKFSPPLKYFERQLWNVS